ncbi:MAG TPA: four helix bundle protein [Gemmatimonadaceae bacterium]|nr:four helix bundle protein [Gemmatimonadaceae bacterium]
MRVRSAEDLIVWRHAMELVGSVYEIAARLPSCERQGLAEQMRRAATSIPANIAEGHARGHGKDFLRFLLIARGSLAEVRTHLAITTRVGYTTRAELERSLSLADETSRMLTAMLRSLQPPPPDR